MNNFTFFAHPHDLPAIMIIIDRNKVDYKFMGDPKDSDDGIGIIISSDDQEYFQYAKREIEYHFTKDIPHEPIKKSLWVRFTKWVSEIHMRKSNNFKYY